MHVTRGGVERVADSLAESCLGRADGQYGAGRIWMGQGRRGSGGV